MASEFTKTVAEDTARKFDDFYAVYGKKYFDLRKLRKAPQMSTDLTERYENAKRYGEKAASSLTGVAGNAVSASMGTDEIGRMYASAFNPVATLASFGINMGVLGLTYLHFKGRRGAITTAKQYGEVMNARGGNGFTAVPLADGSSIRLGAYDGNTGATNLANMEKMFGDHLGSEIVKAEPEALMRFESELINNNVVFCDRTIGTLELNLGIDVPQSVLDDIKEELKLRGFGDFKVDGGNIKIPNIEQADAESIVHELYRCKAKEEGALVSYLAKDEKFRNLNNQKIAEILRSDRNSVISSLTDKNGNWNKKIKESFDRYNTYELLPLTEMPITNEKGEASNWLCLNRLKKSGDGSGFVNEVNGIEMPMEFSYMGRDRNKFNFVMSNCGISRFNRDSGEMTYEAFMNLSAKNGFNTTLYQFAGKTNEQFSSFMREVLPDVPWAKTDREGEVWVKSGSIDAISKLARQRGFMEPFVSNGIDDIMSMDQGF